MNFEFLKLANNAAASQQGTGGAMDWLPTIGMFAVIILVFYFLMIRPQKKRQKEEENMRNSLKIGDEIVTIGGFFGRVVNIKDDSIIIESLADHSKMKILRGAIQTNRTAEEDAKKAREQAKKEKAAVNGK